MTLLQTFLITVHFSGNHWTVSDMVSTTKCVLLALVGYCGTVPLSARSLPGPPCCAQHPAPLPLWSSLLLLLTDTKTTEVQVGKIFGPKE